MSPVNRCGALILVMSGFLAMGSLPVSARRMATDNHITYYQRSLQRNPLNSRAYLGLGDALIRKARETGDPSYFNRAEEALKKALEIDPKSAGAMRHLAYVFYSRHEFEPAAGVFRAQSQRFGDKAKAQKFLRSALSTNPYFHVLLADEAARTLKALQGATDSAALRR